MKKEEINTAIRALDDLWKSYCHLVECAYDMYASDMDYVQTECIGLHQWRTKGGIDGEMEWVEAKKALEVMESLKDVLTSSRDKTIVEKCMEIVKDNLGV